MCVLFSPKELKALVSAEARNLSGMWFFSIHLISVRGTFYEAEYLLNCENCWIKAWFISVAYYCCTLVGNPVKACQLHCNGYEGKNFKIQLKSHPWTFLINTFLPLWNGTDCSSVRCKSPLCIERVKIWSTSIQENLIKPKLKVKM